jgi:4-amino-4-deoxy-L-arabinose transferase-like glycosyltransferase
LDVKAGLAAGRRGIRCTAAAILVLALAVRVLAMVATPAYLPLHDDRDYDRLACWIADHGSPPDRAPPTPGPTGCAERGRPGPLTAYRPPLWPLALGGAYAVAEAFGVPRWTAGRALEALIGTAVVALTGAIAARLWDATVGLLAMALAAVFLPLVLDGATLISEPLFVALELGAVLAILQYRRRPRGVGWAVAAGALVGLAALTRANGALLAAPLLVAILARPRGRRTVGVAAFAAAAVVVVAPWTVRNALVLGAFVPVSTETGPTLLGTYNATARDAPGCTGCWILLSHSPAELGLAHRLGALTEVQRDRESRALAARFAARHPGYVAQVAWGNSLRLLELGGEQRTRFAARTIDVPPGAAVVGAWQLWLVLAVTALGAATGALRRVPPGLVSLIAFLWLTTVLVQGETPRFRAPLDPFLLMLAALGLAVVGARALRGARRRRAARAAPPARRRA